MRTLNQSQSIKIGLVLEACIAEMLTQRNYSFINSESYEDMLTRPDFILTRDGKPFASIAVTTTASGETWIKKRWRYIDEVAQLKSYFGPNFLVINIFYGNTDVFQTSELKVINSFFDASIAASGIGNGDAILDYAIDQVIDTNSQYIEIVKCVMSFHGWKSHSVSLMDKINEVIKRRTILTQNNLFRKVWEKEYPSYRKRLMQVKKHEYSSKVAFLRYVVLNGMLIGQENIAVLIDAVKKERPISKEIVNQCINTKFEFSQRLNKHYISDIKLKITVEDGFSANDYAAIERVAFSNPTQEYLLKDIQDPNRIKEMVLKSWTFFDTINHIGWLLQSAFISNSFLEIPHVRVWTLDVACAIINESISSISRDFTEKFGHQGIFNPVKNFITKTALVQNQFSNPNVLKQFCKNLAKLLYEKINELDRMPSSSEVIQYLAEKKRADLDLQPFINPLQRYLEIILSKNDCTFKKTSISCMLGAISDIPGRMKKIQDIYRVKKNGKEIWIKCIGGYDGVKDKTREMAARGKLLQYEDEESSKRNVRLMFVYDGSWPKELQELLVLSGWNDIIPIFELDSNLKQIFRK